MADSSALLSTEIEFENDIKKDPNAVKYWWALPRLQGEGSREGAQPAA